MSPPADAAGLRRVAGPAVVLTLVSLMLVCSYAFALASPKPHHLPVAVVGPARQIEQVRARLARTAPGSFALRQYPTAAAARDAILDREVYGAFVLRPRSTLVLTAEAAGPPAARALQGAAAPLAQANGTQLRAIDLRPLPERDSVGNAAYFFQFGVLIPAFVFSVLVALIARSATGPTRLAGSTAFVVLCGFAAALAVDPVAGTLTGSFWALAGIAMLLAAAVVGLGAGLSALVGPSGLALAFVVLIVLGNPASGSTQPHEFLPVVYRQVSQWLPPGAALTAVRNAVYFQGHALLRPTLTLAGWAAAGLVVGVVAAAARRLRPPPSERAG